MRSASPIKPTELTTTSLMWSKAKAWTEELLLFRHMMYMPIFITMTPTVPPAQFMQSEFLKATKWSTKQLLVKSAGLALHEAVPSSSHPDSDDCNDSVCKGPLYACMQSGFTHNIAQCWELHLNVSDKRDSVSSVTHKPAAPPAHMPCSKAVAHVQAIRTCPI